MDKSVIAVRIANGTFVPVIDTSTRTRTRRRLVLTTVRDDQTSVQIDLYRGEDEFLENSEYVGSLMIENIEPAPKGQADIALLIGVDDSDNLNATATDKNSGEYQSLSVSLESIDQGSELGMPDFELSDEALTLEDLSMDDEEIALEESAAELSLDDMTLEDDLSLDLDSEQGTDTLAADAVASEAGVEDLDIGALDIGDLDTGDDAESTLAGMEEFSEDAVALDDSFSEEPVAAEVMLEEEDLEEPASEEAGEELATEDIAGLGEGMVEAELGDEDFSFDDVETMADDNLFDESLGVEEEPADGGAQVSEFGEPEFGEPEFGEPEFAESPIGDGVDDEMDQLEADIRADEFAQIDTRPDESALHSGFGAAAQTLAPRRSNAIVFVGYIVLALAALGVLTYLVFRLLEGPPAPPLKAAILLALPVLPRRRATRRRGSLRRSP